QVNGGRNAVRFIENPETERPQSSTGDGKQMLVYLNNNVIAISPDLAQIQSLAEYFKNNGEGRRFGGDSFYDRIHQAYESGATWLFAVNMLHITHIALSNSPRRI